MNDVPQIVEINEIIEETQQLKLLSLIGIWISSVFLLRGICDGLEFP